MVGAISLGLLISNVPCLLVFEFLPLLLSLIDLADCAELAFYILELPRLALELLYGRLNSYGLSETSGIFKVVTSGITVVSGGINENF